ncbi:hypothetical protein BB560_006398, partial [Smittium megazygosporum]
MGSLQTDLLSPRKRRVVEKSNGDVHEDANSRQTFIAKIKVELYSMLGASNQNILFNQNISADIKENYQILSANENFQDLVEFKELEKFYELYIINKKIEELNDIFDGANFAKTVDLLLETTKDFNKTITNEKYSEYKELVSLSNVELVKLKSLISLKLIKDISSTFKYESTTNSVKLEVINSGCNSLAFESDSSVEFLFTLAQKLEMFENLYKSVIDPYFLKIIFQSIKITSASVVLSTFDYTKKSIKINFGSILGNLETGFKSFKVENTKSTLDFLFNEVLKKEKPIDLNDNSQLSKLLARSIGELMLGTRQLLDLKEWNLTFDQKHGIFNQIKDLFLEFFS